MRSRQIGESVLVCICLFPWVDYFLEIKLPFYFFWVFVSLSVDWDSTVGSLVQNAGFHELICFEYGHTLACSFPLCL